MIKLFLKFWPFLFIVLVWFVFSKPYFLKGLVPYSSTYQVNFFPPWSSYEKFWGPVKNNAMPDIHGQIYPWKKFTIDTFIRGEIPLWNPYSFAGNPHVANYQSAVFSPFSLLFFVIPFIDAWSILILAQPLIAGLFMYLFVREIGVGRVGSLISSVSFMFSGFMVVWMAYGTLVYAILYLPLALYAVECYYRSGSFKFLLILILTVSLSLFSGHFQISFYFFIGLIYYILFRAFIKRSIRSTTFLLISVIFGLIVAAPQLVSSIMLYKNSIRSELFQVGEAIPLQYLITVISPDFFGNPVTRNDWFGHYAEWSSFIGIWPLFLAIYAIVRLRSWRILFFSTLGLGSVALAVNSPLSVLLVSLKIPVLSTSALSRIIVLFSFSFAALAGLGFDKLLKDVDLKKARKTTVLILGSISIFFAVTWILVLIGKIYPDEWLIVAKRNLILPTLLFFIGTFLFLMAVRKKTFLIFAICYLLFAISFDSLRFAQKWMPFDPKEYVFPEVPVIAAIKKNIGDGRIFGNIGGEVTTYYKFPSIDGYDPLYIGRYGEFIRSASIGKFLNAERSVVKLDRREKYTNRVLDLLGVSLIFHPVADTNQGWAFPVWEDKTRFSLIYQEDKFQLFRNNLSLPRATLFYNFEVIKENKEIIKRFYSDDFDFRKVLILEETPNLKVEKEAAGSAKIISYTPNKVVIRVASNSPGLLFLSDNYYPGWKVRIDGKISKIYRADYSFRAVMVAKGESVVEFEYSLL
ncbi:MAG: YfhO family protein [Patescibacteria group bacterium]